MDKIILVDARAKFVYLKNRVAVNASLRQEDKQQVETER